MEPIGGKTQNGQAYQDIGSMTRGKGKQMDLYTNEFREGLSKKGEEMAQKKEAHIRKIRTRC